MKRLHLFLIKSFIPPFIVTTFIALFILLMHFVWLYIDDLVGKGLPWYILTELFAYISMTLIPMAMPISVLLASIMSFGNLGEHYELTAIKSSGISLLRFLKPMMVFILGISILVFMFANYVLPVANLKGKTLLHDVAHQKPAFKIKPGIFYNEIENYSIKVKEKNKETDELKGILIYEHKTFNGNTKVITAKTGKMAVSDNGNELFLTLYNGAVYEEVIGHRHSYKIRPHQQIEFAEQVIRFDMSNFGMKRTDESVFEKKYSMQNIAQISTSIDSLNVALINKKNKLKYKLYHYYYYKNYAAKNHPKVKQKDSNPFAAIKEVNNNKNTIVKKINTTTNTATENKNTEIVSTFYETYNKLNYDKKDKILEVALTLARSAKSYISSYNDDCKARQKNIIKHHIERHKRLSISVACFLLFLVGAPLGAIIRKGGLGLPLIASVIIFVFYYMITIIGEKLTQEGTLIPEIGMWISTIILLPLGLFLLYKSNNDSKLLSIDSYIKYINKLFRKKTQ